MKSFKGLVPGYKGDCVGHIVRREIGRDDSRSMVPKKVDGEVVGWIPVKRSQKIEVTFRWDGVEWQVWKVG